MIGPQETTKQFLVRPGHVKARDGDIHHISASQLMDLYKVPPHLCLLDTPENLRGYTNEAIASLLLLTPRQDGDYPDYSGRNDIHA